MKVRVFSNKTKINHSYEGQLIVRVSNQSLSNDPLPDVSLNFLMKVIGGKQTFDSAPIRREMGSVGKDRELWSDRYDRKSQTVD
jgi:hypothetical protein